MRRPTSGKLSVFGHGQRAPLSAVRSPGRAGLTVHVEMTASAEGTRADEDAARLAERQRKLGDEVLTFPDQPPVPFDDNSAERMIRLALGLREDSRPNRDGIGAGMQAGPMSAWQTLIFRGHEPPRQESRRTLCVTDPQGPANREVGGKSHAASEPRPSLRTAGPTRLPCEVTA